MKKLTDILREKSTSPSVVLASVIAGLCLGNLSPGFSLSINFVSELYVNLLKMITLPFMMAAVIYSITLLLKSEDISGILGRIVSLFFFFMFACTLVGLVVGFVMGPGRGLSEHTLSMLGKLVGEDLNHTDQIEMTLFGKLPVVNSLRISDTLMGIVPNNIFVALFNGDTVKVLIFSLIIGLVVGHLPSQVSQPLIDALNGIFHACLKLTIWLNYLLPLVLIAMVAYQTATMGIEPLKMMLGFIVTLGVASLIVIFVSFIALQRASGQKWKTVWDSQRETIFFVIATRNSMAAIPLMIDGLVKHLGFNKSRIELMVPLGVSLLRVGPALFYTIATLFIAQLYGRVLLPFEWVIIVIASVIAAFASSGMTGLTTISLTGIVCSLLGLPFESLIVLFAAIDTLSNTLRVVVTALCANAFAAMACKQENENQSLKAVPEGCYV